MDPLHCNMAYLYLELLKDSLNEYAYAAELAGLNYDLQNTVYGMYVSIQTLDLMRSSTRQAGVGLRRLDDAMRSV